MTNEQVREAFLEYYMDNYKPNLILVAKEIGLSHTYLLKFKNGQVEMEPASLAKVMSFLNNQLIK